MSRVIDSPVLSPGLPARRRLRTMACGIFVAALVLVTAVGAELTARIQDWIRDGIPLTATPNWDKDLFVDTTTGRRGRPNGHYKKWRLNEFGFRSGPMSITPQAGTVRVLVLGASETFGLYESPGHEFPARLDTILTSSGKYEVINAALTGLTLDSTLSYWEDWVSRFCPAVVVIYPSPLFYLSDLAPGRRSESVPVKVSGSATHSPAVRPGVNSDVGGTLLASSRIVGRARDQLDVPDFLQRVRDARTIEAAARDKPSEWFFRAAPADRVRLFIDDLDRLARAIERSGARLVVLTHAMRVADPARAQDLDWLSRARVNTPRALPEVLNRFQTVTNEAIRTWGRQNGVPIVDVAAELNGREELFGDLIHFNDSGADLVAAAVAHRVADLVPAVATVESAGAGRTARR